MTFWSNTGEALQRQPDNFYGLQVSKSSYRYVYYKILKIEMDEIWV